MRSPITLTTQPPAEQARAEIVAHHAALRQQLDAHVEGIRDAIGRGEPHGAALDRLTAFLADEVLVHAAAEEGALYPAAAAYAPASLLVAGMILEHRALAREVAALRSADTPLAAVAAAQAVAALFAVHVEKENDVLLPALIDDGVDLPTLLTAMHDAIEAAGSPAAADGREIDVQSLPHGGRHDMIFTALQGLRPGQGLVVVNDHDPRPLRHQIDALWPATFDWSYVTAGPQVWRVAISRRPTS